MVFGKKTDFFFTVHVHALCSPAVDDVEVSVADGESPPGHDAVSGSHAPSQEEELKAQHHRGTHITAGGKHRIHTLGKLEELTSTIKFVCCYSTIQYSTTKHVLCTEVAQGRKK